MRVGNSKTVRSEETDAVLKGDGPQLFLHLGACGARFPEAAGYNNGMLDTFPAAIFHGLADNFRWQNDNCHVRYFGQIHNAGISLVSAYFFFCLMNRIYFPFIT